MNEIGVGLVQLNVTVGALKKNADLMLARAEEATQAGVQVVAFPELSLCGYPPEDLILKEHFVTDCEKMLHALAARLPAGLVALVGTPTRKDGRVFNSAAICANGKVQAIYHKMLLPNYGVFDEKRVFQPGTIPCILEVAGFRLGLHICEDSWFLDAPPCQVLRHGTLDAIINISASPYHRGKLAQRVAILGQAAAATQCPILYCNLTGGQDELVFDGAGMVVLPSGQVAAQTRPFMEDTLFWRLQKTPAAIRALDPAPIQAEVISLPAPPPPSPPPPCTRIAPPLVDPEEVYAALKLGLRDYVSKNGFRGVVVALSGGIDSALVATLAVDALGADKVQGVTMPSPYSSTETRGDAERLARNLGIGFRSISISGIFQIYLDELSREWPGRAPDTTEENIQARIRGNIIMALSNKFGWLVLTTGNKSEMATGYCTLYGDMAGGFAVIKDVPKTLVFELARWRNAQAPAAPPIPPTTIDRPPSAELRPNQKDSDSLPPYETLDPILERYVERDMGFDAITADGFDPAVVRRVIRLVDLNEYKRRQGAPGIKITPKAFGRDRRMPITNLYREATGGTP